MNRVFSKGGLSLERLKTFVEVVVAGGISNAAPGDSNRQSQFSRQLKELESFFGAEMLRRGRGRFELTAAGLELFTIVQSHFNALEDLMDRCAGKRVEVRLGAGESLLYWLISPCLPKFHLRRPSVTLVLQNLRTAEIVSRLSDGRLDVGLLRENAVGGPLQSRKIGNMSYGLWVPETVKSQDVTVWDLLQNAPVAVLEQNEITGALEKEAQAKGLNLDVCFRGSSYPQLREASKRFGCSALTPVFGNATVLDGGTILPIPELKPFQRALVVAWQPRFAELRPEVLNSVSELSEFVSGELASKT